MKQVSKDLISINQLFYGYYHCMDGRKSLCLGKKLNEDRFQLLDRHIITRNNFKVQVCNDNGGDHSFNLSWFDECYVASAIFELSKDEELMAITGQL